MRRWLPLAIVWLMAYSLPGSASVDERAGAATIAAQVTAPARVDGQTGDHGFLAPTAFRTAAELRDAPISDRDSDDLVGAPAARRSGQLHRASIGVLAAVTEPPPRQHDAPGAARPPPDAARDEFAAVGSAARRPVARQAPLPSRRLARAPYFPTAPPATI